MKCENCGKEIIKNNDYFEHKTVTGCEYICSEKCVYEFLTELGKRNLKKIG